MVIASGAEAAVRYANAFPELSGNFEAEGVGGGRIASVGPRPLQELAIWQIYGRSEMTNREGQEG